MVMILLGLSIVQHTPFFLLSNNLLYHINIKLQIESFYSRYVNGIINL